MRVTVIGGSGFVGASVISTLQSLGVDARATPAPRLERLTMPAAYASLKTSAENCDVLVNAAGLARPLGRDSQSLERANGVLPGLIATAAESAGIRLVHISSAAVQGRSRTLDDSPETAPLSAYARSKALGEVAVSRSSARAVIFRPPGVHHESRATTRSLARLARSPLSTVSGQGNYNTPQALIENVASAIAFICAASAAPRIIHYPSEQITAFELLELLGGKPPASIPPLLASSFLRFIRRAPGDLACGYVRRLEMIWLGQDQADSWLTTSGWSPPVGKEGWLRIQKLSRNG